MSGAGGKRRSLLANAIENLGTTPEPKAEVDEARVAEHPAEESSGPSFLERRGVAFDEIARAVKRPTIRLKPSECSIWPGNARDHAALSYERCASLIESIREEGTNREPVVVRRTPNGELPYELIVGTRRHFSVSWLRANNHSEIDLIARIETLDDEAAFRLADLENREREDVTDLERARNYRQAVDAYYNGVRTQMAERLAIPKQNLHNLLQLAELPDAVIAAFSEPGDIKVRHGMRLSPLLKDERYRGNILTAALEIAEEQESLKASGGPRIEGSRVCERLATAAQRQTSAGKPKSKPVVTTASGNVLGEVLSNTKAKGITIQINPKESASVDEILEALRPIFEGARFSR
ncbi:MAG: ParB/RepB/Spo0J family partition protein [Novosphingobium sp.]|nr:ParB/RepB/Spo0J family partition protein [Novosphingobium sp.]